MNEAERILLLLESVLEGERDEQAGLQAKCKHAADRYEAAKKNVDASAYWEWHAKLFQEQYATELRLCTERCDLLEAIVTEVKKDNRIVQGEKR